MARLKPPIPDKVYFPSQGWNPDAGGLSIKTEEAADLLNYRVDPEEIRTRPGSRRISDNNILGDPILKFHTYKAPAGNELLFGFTQNTPYVFSDAAGEWVPAVNIRIWEDGTSAASWVAGPNVTVTSTGFTPGDGGFTALIPASAISIIRDTTGTVSVGDLYARKTGLGEDFTNIKRMVFWRTLGSAITELQDGIDLTIEFRDAGAVLLASTNITMPLNTVGNAWTGFSFNVPVAARTNTVDEIRILFNEAFTPTANVVFLLAASYAIDATENDVSFWSTTDFLDDTQGATVIAAGSNPPNPTDDETDGAQRALLFYDTTAAEFDDLQLTEDVAVVDEDTGEVTIRNATITNTVDAAILSGFNNILSGTLVVSTIPNGTFGKASSITVQVGGVDANGLFEPVDLDVIDETPADSFIKFVSGDLEVKFLNYSTTFFDTGAAIFTSYDYNIDVDVKPRFVFNFKGRLILANTFESPNFNTSRVRWTQIADITTLRRIDFADLVDNDISPIVAGDKLQDKLMIYKEESITRGTHVGGTAIFAFFTVWKEGMYASQTLASYQGRHYFLGIDDVYVFDGVQTRSLTLDPSTGSFRVRNRILQTLDETRIWNFLGFIHQQAQEYWVMVVEQGESFPTSVYVYNIKRNIWYFYRFSETPAIGVYHLQSLTTIDELIGTIDEQNWILSGGVTGSLIRSPIISRDDGDTFVIDEGAGSDYATPTTAGTAISTRLITRDFIFSDLARKDRTERVQFEAYGSTIDVGSNSTYSIETNDFIQKNTIALTPAYVERKYFPDITFEHIRFIFETSAYNAIRWIHPYAVQKERH